jgi:hypothetical protein
VIALLICMTWIRREATQTEPRLFDASRMNHELRRVHEFFAEFLHPVKARRVVYLRSWTREVVAGQSCYHFPRRFEL